MDYADSGPTTATLVATRHQLHGIAEFCSPGLSMRRPVRLRCG
jgi:hypothetical protein